MAIGTHGSSSLVALLRIIFSQASTHVSLAGLTETERNRNVAFYDEVVTVSIRMNIPASNRTLPAPAHDARSSFRIPLRLSSFDENDEDDEDDHSDAPPPLLALLLSSLSISLEAAYVPPRLSKAAAPAVLPSESESSSNTHVMASVADEDTAYQAVPLYGRGEDGAVEATRMFVKAWQGNTVPPKLNLKKPTSKKGKEAMAAANKQTGGADVWFTREGGEESWTVEWRCQVPIVFLRSRHPTPALVLCANLAMQLQPSRLSALAPSIAPPVSTSASEALFLHDLLNPLSEGPSYPDESPAERAARADASLAKLPLGKLPSSILGSKLVTPARSAKDVGRLIDARQRMLMDNDGDMGDVASDDEWSNGRIVGGSARHTQSQASTDEAEQGLGEDVVTVRRSARRALDVRSAVLVRMRTTNIAGIGEGFGQAPDASEVQDYTTPTPTLILCVEIENPANSGVKFALDDIGVQVVVPSEAYGALHPTNRVHVNTKPIGNVPTPLVVEQGGQYNLLYRVDFVMPYFDATDASTADAFDPSTLMSETQRTITIELFGRPIMLRRNQDTGRSGEPYSPGESFTSTWSCTLDFATQIQAVILQHIIAQGAGGFSLGKVHGELTARKDVHASARGTSSDRMATPPSIVAERRVESLQQMRAKNMHGDARQTSMVARHGANAQRPSLRLGTGHVSDTFVSLQRSPDLREGSGAFVRGSFESLARRESSATPAMPSSLVGPSILARARKNRIATLDNNDGGGSRLNGAGRRSTLVHSPHTITSSDSAMVPGRISSSSWHVRNALSGSHHTFDVSSLPVLPLGSKATWTRLAHLVQNASEEQGILIDITGVVDADVPDQRDDSGRILFHYIDVHLQLDNRSESMRTVLLQWKKTPVGQRSLQRGGAMATAAADAASDSVVWLAEDDAVQVGPIAAGQAELAVLRLRQTVSQDDSTIARTVPPLLLTDVESGHQHTLMCVQPLVV